MMRTSNDNIGGSLRSPLSYIVVIIAAVAGVYLLWNSDAHSDEPELGQTLEIYDLAFAASRDKKRRLLLWEGDEHFCIVADEVTGELSLFAKNAIEAVSETFGLSFTVVVTPHVSSCTKPRTRIYILLGQNPGYDGIADFLEIAVESRPPRSLLHYDGNLGFMMSLPGPVHRNFVFVSTSKELDSPHSTNEKAIFLEELLHVLLGGSDFVSDGIVSQLGENVPAGGYEFWYQNNPRGWCKVDFLFMELLFGDHLLRTARFEAARASLIQNYQMLQQGSLRRREILASLSDERC